jgi:hypothetical protein
VEQDSLTPEFSNSYKEVHAVPYIGVDSMKLSIPTTDADPSAIVDAVARPKVKVETGELVSTSTVGRLPCGLRASLHESLAGKKVIAEGSLPKAVHGSNRQALDPKAAVDFVDETVRPELLAIAKLPPKAEINVTRIDTAQDIDAAPDDMAALFDEIAKLAWLSPTVYRDGGAIETVDIVNGSHHLRMYDKARECGDLNYSIPSLRIEAQHNRYTLRRKQFRTLGTLDGWADDPFAVQQLHITTLDWLKLPRTFDVPQEAIRKWWDAAIEQGWSELKIDRFLAFKLRREKVLPEQESISPNWLLDFRMLSRHLKYGAPANGRVALRLDVEGSQLIRSDP